MNDLLIEEANKPQWSIEAFLRDTKTIQDTKGVDAALDHILTCVNFFLYNQIFDEVQKIVDAIDVTQFSPTVLICFCTEFWNAQRDGIIYEPFRLKCEEEIKRVEPETNVDEIFRGLKGVPTGPTLGSMLRGVQGANQELY